MSFVRLICAVCNGEPTSTVCTNCDGMGTTITHANAIGSGFTVTCDPAAPSSDEVWATIWRRHDDGSLELIESGKVPPLKE